MAIVPWPNQTISTTLTQHSIEMNWKKGESPQILSLQKFLLPTLGCLCSRWGTRTCGEKKVYGYPNTKAKQLNIPWETLYFGTFEPQQHWWTQALSLGDNAWLAVGTPVCPKGVKSVWSCSSSIPIWYSWTLFCSLGRAFTHIHNISVFWHKYDFSGVSNPVSKSKPLLFLVKSNNLPN